MEVEHHDQVQQFQNPFYIRLPLPGQQVATASELTLVGGSSFGPASENLTVQISNLPQYTVLDSILPWLIIGAASAR